MSLPFDNVFFDTVFNDTVFNEPRYVLEIFSKFGKNLEEAVNNLSIYYNNGLEMLKIHKGLKIVITLHPGAMPNLMLRVEIRHTFSGLNRAGEAVGPSASIRDFTWSPMERTFTFVIQPSHYADGRGPRRADDPNAFTVYLYLYDGEGASLDVSMLRFATFANPNGRENERCVLQVVPCFLNTGLLSLTPSSKEAFLGGTDPSYVVFGLPAPEQNANALEVGFAESQNSPSSALDEVGVAEEYQNVEYFSEIDPVLDSVPNPIPISNPDSVPEPYEFVNSPCDEYPSLFEDHHY